MRRGMRGAGDGGSTVMRNSRGPGQGSRTVRRGRRGRRLRALLALLLTAGIAVSTAATAPSTLAVAATSAEAPSPPASPAPSTATPAQAVDEFAAARVRWRSHLTGGSDFDPAAAPYKSVVQRITDTARAHWGTLYARPTTELWPDLSTATSVADVYESYGRLKAMALAFMTHGSPLKGDPELQAALLRSLDWLHANRYNTTTVRDTSTWYWALGIPLHLNDITVLLYERLGAPRIKNYMAAVNRFLPGVYTTGVYSTGANRAWSVMVVALRGVIVKDESKTRAARDGIVPVMQYVTTGDGYYADGSYIQHSSLAYNGGYGVSALGMISQVLYLFHGSPWQVNDPSVSNIHAAVNTAYAPFLVNGAMMDAVRGKEASRERLPARAAGSTTIRMVALLAESAPAAAARDLRARAKQLLSEADIDQYRATSSVTDLTRSSRILSDASLPAAADLDGTYAFNAMARFVRRAPGYAFAVSASGARTTNFETGTSGENQKAWYTGDGMTYLYTDDTDQFSADYWATVNRYRLPGTTVDSRTMAVNEGRNYRSRQTMVGGVKSVSGTYGAFAMVLDAAGSPLVANKAWFTFDDEIVALGSGISAPGQTGTGWDGSARHVETIVDDRRVEATGQTLTLDGAAIPATGARTAANPSWAQLSGSVGQVGYVFPGTGPVTVARTTNSGSWFAINAKEGSRDIRTDSYFSLWVDHGRSPANATYSYVLLPNSSSEKTRVYATTPETVILANTTSVSAVKERTMNAIGAVFWTDSPTALPVGGKPFLSTSSRSIILTGETSTGIDVAVTDPTQLNTGRIAVEIQRPASGLTAASRGVTVTQLSPTIKFTVDVAGAAGAKFTARFTY